MNSSLEAESHSRRDPLQSGDAQPHRELPVLERDALESTPESTQSQSRSRREKLRRKVWKIVARVGLGSILLGGYDNATAQTAEPDKAIHLDAALTDAAAQQEEAEDARDVLGIEPFAVKESDSPVLHALLERKLTEADADSIQVAFDFEIQDGQAVFFSTDGRPQTFDDLQIMPESDLESAFIAITSYLAYVQNQNPDRPIGRQRIELVALRDVTQAIQVALNLRVLTPFLFPFRTTEQVFPAQSMIVFRGFDTVNYQSPRDGSTVELLPVTPEILDALSAFPELQGRELPTVGEILIAEFIELPNADHQLTRLPVSLLANGEVIELSSELRVVSRGDVANVRSGPGTQFAVIGQLGSGQVTEATPVPTATPDIPEPSGDTYWIRLNLNGQIGYVRGDVAKIEGLPPQSVAKIPAFPVWSAELRLEADSLLAIPSEALATAPVGAEVTLANDNVPVARTAYDSPTSPRYRWENGAWVDQHPGRDAYEYLINYHDASRLFDMWGERIVGWNQEMLAYERDDGLFYYPLLGAGYVGADPTRDTDLLDGWVSRTETLASATLRLELTMAENHPLFSGVRANPDLNAEARRVLLAEIQRLYPNIRGTVIVQIVAEDVTRDSFARVIPAPGGDIQALVGRIRDYIAYGFNTVETPSGNITFIRISQTTTPSANPNDPLYRYGLDTLDGILLTFDEITYGRTRNSSDILGPAVMQPLKTRTLAANDHPLEPSEILVTIPKAD